MNKVTHKGIKTKGMPKVMVARGGFFSIGKNFRINNTINSNPIGCVQPCMFFVDSKAKLVLGDNVSLSQTAIVCHENIVIGNNVKMGGGVCVYDTDFHSLDKNKRTTIADDFANKKMAPVYIKDNVFIGANTTILKGVTVGENSIIGACSLVSKNIPSNEIWAGNPARKIKSII
ncbi:acyltransferase [uncultured Maribacter sp.]|uniref:acyltransferase n=1 Tax=uncultured Maribacter sp. TaxID=431308 RepID=UPI0026251174|nr:acyltransferase [uncultured Maribacter sp.]